MKLFRKRLNQKGFSHHLILPVLVILAITGLGVYLLKFSRAATTSSSCTPGAPAKSPALVTMSDSSGSKSNRYFKVTSNGCNQTELKANVGTAGLHFTGPAHSSTDFSAIVGAVGRYGVDVYSVQNGSIKNLRLNAGPLGASVQDVRYSTNGAHLVYTLESMTVDRGHVWNIYTANPDGTNIKLSYTRALSPTNVSMQPNGFKIAMIERGVDYPELKIINLDGSVCQDLGAIGRGSSYAWSPDGTKIGFIAGPTSQITVADVNCSGDNKHPYNAKTSSNLSFSPDGKSLAYISGPINSDKMGGLAKLDLSTGDSQEIVPGGYGIGGIRWLNDWSIVFIKYTAPRQTSPEVESIDANAAGQPKTLLQLSNSWDSFKLEPNP